ncbi:MAG: type II toxin-antitoxin system RelE/ParE family toxin [Bacteroidales bacterium]
MKSISKVIWSQRAKTDLNSILDYLEENRTKKEIGKFFRKLDKQISIIQNQPKAFPAREKNNVQRSVFNQSDYILL